MNAIIVGQSGGGSGGGGGSNASVGLNGGAGPGSSTQIGDVVGGVFTPFSPANPVPISGTITANNASVGPTGSPVPADATYLGVENNSGNLVGVSASNPIRIDPTGTTIQPVSGTITALQGTSPWVVSGTVTITPSGLQNVNVTEWNTVALGSPSAYGTSPGAVNVIGVNAFITNTPAVTLASTTITGTVAVTQSTSPWVVSLASTTITGTVADNLIQVAGVTLGATAVVAYGSTPAAANVPAVNAFVTNTVTVSGAVTVTNATAANLKVQAVGLLTTNNAAPTGTLIGVLPAIAETAYTTVTYTTGDMVLPVTDLHGAFNQDLQAYAGTQLTGTVTAYGTAPTGNVFGVNAFITNTVATTLASTTITGTVAVTQSTSPWVVSGTVTITPSGLQNVNVTEWNTVALGSPSAYGTSPGAVNVIGVNAFITNTVPVTLASTTITGTVAVTQSTTPWIVAGALTNNNAAPTATLLGVMGAIAETSYATLTYTTGDMVLPVTDLHGAFNTDLQAVGGTAVVTAGPGRQQVGITGSSGGILDAVTTAATAPANGLATLVEYLSQANQPAITTGQSVMLQGDPTGALSVNTEGRKPTFSASATFTGAAGVIAMIPGSASKTIRILRIEVSIYTTGTAAIETISLVKTSTAPTGGTSAAMPAVPHDSGDPAATSLPLSFTVAPTVGTAVGTIRAVAFADSSNAALPGANTWLWDFGVRPGQCIVLRGTAQTLEIILGGAVATQTCIVSFEWTSDNS